MTPHKVTTTFWDHATLWGDDESLAGHTTDGGRVFGITRTRYIECDHYNCQPVAVVPYEDREQVERLAESIARGRSQMGGWATAVEVSLSVQAALREFANPKPPKPEEPTGLGAVVEDAEGQRWVRTYGDASQDDYECWKREHYTTRHRWSEIDVVRVLSEGVRS